MKYVIFDTETTDLRGEVIQLAYMLLDSNFDIVDFDSFYCDTTKVITKGAFDVHGISNEVLEVLSNGKNLEDYILSPKHKKVFFSKGTVFIGYNVTFDIARVNQTLVNQTTDTDNVGVTFSPRLRTNRLVGLNENETYHLDAMMFCRQYFKMVKGLTLGKAFELSNIKFPNHTTDEMFEHFRSKYGVESKGLLHDAAYDVFLTYLIMLKFGNLMC